MNSQRIRAVAPALLGVARACEALNRRMGETVAWLALAMVVIAAAVALLRYLFGLNWVALQESVTYLHALLFMLTAGYALQRNAHVRVDIFYQCYSLRTRAWINLFGALCLLAPVCLLLLSASWNYVVHSWAIGERSPETGGLPGVWLLKTLLLALPILLLLQGLAGALRDALFLAGIAEAARRSEEPPHA